MSSTVNLDVEAIVSAIIKVFKYYKLVSTETIGESGRPMIEYTIEEK